jgi:protein TonB
VVKLGFVVEPTGRISNLTIDQTVGGGCNEEAIRLLKLLQWMPAIKDKKAVRSRASIEIKFVLPTDSQHKMFDYNQSGG